MFSNLVTAAAGAVSIIAYPNIAMRTVGSIMVVCGTASLILCTKYLSTQKKSK